jgi:hypothetical protein
VGFNQAFFFDLFLRWFFAAFMLSTKFGYGRPARFADAFAPALLFLLNFEWRLLRGAGFFQGWLLLFVAIIADSLSAVFWDVTDRIGPIIGKLTGLARDGVPDDCSFEHEHQNIQMGIARKRRIHQTPNSREIATCRPWLEPELRLIKPRVLVCLGSTAAGANSDRLYK